MKYHDWKLPPLSELLLIENIFEVSHKTNKTLVIGNDILNVLIDLNLHLSVH